MTSNGQAAAVPAVIEKAKEIQDPERRARKAAAEIKRLTLLVDQWRDEVRDPAAKEMLARGDKVADVARTIGVTRALMARRFLERDEQGKRIGAPA